MPETFEAGFSIVPGPPNVQRVFEIAALLGVLPWTDAAAAISGRALPDGRGEV